jgi:hypothetical protein
MTLEHADAYWALWRRAKPELRRQLNRMPEPEHALAVIVGKGDEMQVTLWPFADAQTVLEKYPSVWRYWASVPEASIVVLIWPMTTMAAAITHCLLRRVPAGPRSEPS